MSDLLSFARFPNHGRATCICKRAICRTWTIPSDFVFPLANKQEFVSPHAYCSRFVHLSIYPMSKSFFRETGTFCVIFFSLFYSWLYRVLSHIFNVALHVYSPAPSLVDVLIVSIHVPHIAFAMFRFFFYDIAPPDIAGLNSKGSQKHVCAWLLIPWSFGVANPIYRSFRKPHVDNCSRQSCCSARFARISSIKQLINNLIERSVCLMIPF